MKTAVVYYSKHHGNTKKVLDALVCSHDITLVDALNPQNINLAEYDCIGFASGIYYSKFHKSVLKFAENYLPEHTNVFFLYTYGAKKEGYANAIRKVTAEKSAHILGEFGCCGFNTFGPFKLIGGIAKGHPSQTDFENARTFFDGMIK